MDADGKPRRPAPLPPTARSKHTSSYTSLRTSQSSTTIKCNNNGTGKETVIVVQRKTAKKVPLLMRKFKMDKKGIAGSGSSATSAVNGGSAPAAAAARESVVVRQRTTTNNDSGGHNRRLMTATSLLKHSTQSRNNYQSIQSRPMIIRPGTNHRDHAKKKKAPPPRPPPPKVLQSQSVAASIKRIPDPPSYDDVLRADLSAFMGEAKGPRLKPPAPMRPSSFSISSSSASKPTDLLIDFDAPSAAPINPSVGYRSPPKSLLDLDITSAVSPSAGLLTKPIPRSSSHSFDSLSRSPWMATSNGGDIRRGDDWLQSCLRDSANGVFNRHDDGFSGFNVASSPPPPPLPPRPRIVRNTAAELFGDIETCPSPEPPTSATPPVPPMPSFHMDNDDEIGVVMPPLPPRPKLLDVSKPCAVALYDYTTNESGDLSFRAGDVVTLVHEVNDEWLYGVIDDREGLFPQNFVDIVVPLSDARALEEDVIEGPRCRAIYDFEGENDGELSFAVGDVMSIAERVDSYWFRGKLRGIEGLFPVGYVQELDDLLPIQGSRRTTTTEHGWSSVAGSRCVAIYDFVGELGELTFAEGDRLEVTGVVNDDWFTGRKLESGDDDNDHVQGRFPKNFVEPLE